MLGELFDWMILKVSSTLDDYASNFQALFMEKNLFV